MNGSQEIRTREVKECLLCKREGISLYENLTDRLFDVPGVWRLLKCVNCDLVWLSPRPISEDLGKTYSNYMTHAANGSKGRMEALQEKIALRVLTSTHWYGQRRNGGSVGLLGRVLSWVPLFEDASRRYVMNLHDEEGGRLLDVGCGAGAFLADMHRLGWTVAGVETDPEVAKIAQARFGLSVFTGSLQEASFPPNSFNAITMEHVIEHVEDPLALVRECHRIVKPGGRISIATPNVDCFQHRLFKVAWLELDPPRHLQIFSMRTITRLFELAVPGGFHVQDLRSVSVNTGQMSVVSRSIKRKGRWEMKRLSAREIAESLIFLLAEEVSKMSRPQAGEEILMTVRKC